MNSSCKKRRLLGIIISENTLNTPSVLALHLRKFFFSSDFMKVRLVKCLKILLNKVENACEISILCNGYSYDYRDTATISLCVLEKKT